MSEWKKVRLGDLVSLVIDHRGKTPKKLGGDWAESGYRALSAKTVKTRQIVNEDSIRCVGEEMYRAWMKDEIQRGDILVTSEAPYGEVYYWNSDEKIVLSQRLFGLRIKPEYDSSYVAQYMTTTFFKQEMDARATGTTVFGLRQPELLECKLMLPPLPTQRKIAAVLSALDDKIENNRKICANLEAQAQAIFKSWFVDFEPFGGKMPQGWKMGKLGDVAECNPYRALKKGVKARCVEMADLVSSASFPASWSYKEYSGGMKFANGDTIIARITPCFENGKSAYVNFLEEGEVAFGSTEYVVMASRSVVPPELFYCVAKDPEFISFAKSRMVGSSGRQRFSAEDIAMYPIVIAPDEVYLKVQPLLRSFMDQARTLGFESRSLAATRDALLPKLMSGEIDVEKVKVA